ncbi:hypothetical protein V2G26_008646 [Clonostachys chloroleuca]
MLVLKHPFTFDENKIIGYWDEYMFETNLQLGCGYLVSIYTDEDGVTTVHSLEGISLQGFSLSTTISRVRPSISLQVHSGNSSPALCMINQWSVTALYAPPLDFSYRRKANELFSMPRFSISP